MTFGNASALVIGLLGAMAVGVAIGPSITGRITAPEPASMEIEGAPATPVEHARAARPAGRRRIAAPVMAADRPDLHARLKPV